MSSANLPVLSPRVSPRGGVGDAAGASAAAKLTSWGSHAQLTDRQSLYDLHGHPMQATASGLVAAPPAGCSDGARSSAKDEGEDLSPAAQSSRARAITQARAELRQAA